MTWGPLYLSSVDTDMVWISSLVIVPLLFLLLPFSRDLNLLSLGDEKSFYLGLDPKKAKAFFFVLASLITAVCVALTGIISFVGLVIPHFIRRLVGPDHQMVLPLSMIAGSCFLVFCDTISQRIISPLELPVGVITGIVGGSFFLVFLIKKGYREYG